MKKIQIPNTNPVLDPAYAKAETERIFTPQLKVARDVCDWGSRLFMRIFETCKPKDVGNLVILALFRQLLAMLDATVLQFENGAVYAAEAPLRSMLEASWSLEWLLKKGTDYDRRCYYVAFVRAQRTWLRMLIKGTREHRALRSTGPRAVSVLAGSAGRAEDARRDLREIGKLLRQKSYREINSAFAQRIKDRKRKLPVGQDLHWYQVSRASSPRLMARDLGREDEYFGLYRSFSDTTHGSKVKAHISVFPNGWVRVEPIRSPAKFGSVFSFAMSVAFHTYRAMIEAYRPGEIEMFDRSHAERWRQAYLNVPEVEVVEEK